jgi:PTH1 family peptidyl-tRNA hydrolase
MKLIVGLGNIGREYEKTRHNFGFLAVDFLAKEYGFSAWKEESKFFGQISTGQIGAEKVLLLKPNTYMNISGKATGAVAHFYKISPEDIWIWHDDVDLPFGTIRIKKTGGSGGHNGIKSIISVLGTENFSRLKFGVQNAKKGKIPTDAFVLGKFSLEERSKISHVIQEGILEFLDHTKC